MGFRKGSYAKVWSVEPKFETLTKGRISISRKDKNTGQYVDDFSGFVSFVGSAAANEALRLQVGDRIKLGDVDVTNKYDKERKISYTNFNVYSFEMADNPSGSSNDTSATNNYDVSSGFTSAGDTEIDEDDSDLPF